MNKKLLIVGGIVLLVLLIIGIFVVTGINNTSTQKTITDPELNTAVVSLNETDNALSTDTNAEILEVD